MNVSTIHRIAIFSGIFLVIIIILGSAIPGVRASFTKFLGPGVSPSDTVSNPGISAEYLIDNQKVDEISQLAGWKILAPTWLPEGYRFHNAVFDTSKSVVLLSFLATRQLPGNEPTMTQTKAITMIQALRNDIIPLMVAPSTIVQEITINSQPAAYALGAWESDASSAQATWNNAIGSQNVFWQIENTFLNLITDDNQVNKEDLIKMAGSTK